MRIIDAVFSRGLLHQGPLARAVLRAWEAPGGHRNERLGGVEVASATVILIKLLRYM